MKKVIIMMFVAGQAYLASAQHRVAQQNVPQQQTQSEKDLSNKPVTDQQWVNDLQLSEQQSVKVREISKQRAHKLVDVNKKFVSQPTVRDQKVKEIEQETDAQLAQVLSQDQFINYLELQGRGLENLPETGNTLIAGEESELKEEIKPVAKPAPRHSSNMQSERERAIERRAFEYEQ
ncbi:MAG: hypothetical protein LPJ89_09080 [Hymenobacteraceae bacterium]|nr:hypothetical protein [Hymenobacteraceae bacterium]MDX5396494.1 hypothetical protein [Hymenobacteraceae bacterium]MDX5443917.1 hypothetical protein [Hymenobacteraceae bacterium]MDX5512553.1 hypothetical protein [Hymenobacteraceae bacterium]